MFEKFKKGKPRGFGSIILIVWPFILAFVTFLCISFGSKNQGLIEDWYSQGLYPVISLILSSFSNLIPFSLWDVFWILVVSLFLAGIILVLFRKVRPGKLLLILARSLAILYTLFYLVWGFNYFRPHIETRLGWEAPEADSTVFRSVLDTLIVQINKSHSLILNSDYTDIEKLVEDSYRTNSRNLGIHYPNGKRKPKTMIFSGLFSKLGVYGYFGPFFNEVNLNKEGLPMDYPFSLAHEEAHQFGFARESEANLAAFVVCTTSEDERLKYSAYLSVLIYFLTDAVHMKDYRDFIKKIDKPVIEDIRFRRSFYLGKQREQMHKVQDAVNNAYLKTNHIEKGIKNYNQVVALVISWYENSDHL